MRRMWSISCYEMKWDFKKKKVLFAVSFVAVAAILAGIFFKYVFNSEIVSEPGYLWDNIILFITNGFVSGIFPMIIAGAVSVDSIAWEFDRNTIQPLLSQPVTRSEVYFGKFFEKFLLLTAISILLVVLSVVISEFVAGSQGHLLWVVPVAFGFLLELMLFVALAFLLGALVRQSGFMMIMVAGVYFVALISDLFLEIKEGVRLWMSLLPLTSSNMIIPAMQHFSLSPTENVYLSVNIGSMTGGAYLPVAPLLAYSVAATLLTVLALLLSGFLVFSRLEIKG